MNDKEIKDLIYHYTDLVNKLSVNRDSNKTINKAVVNFIYGNIVAYKEIIKTLKTYL